MIMRSVGEYEISLNSYGEETEEIKELSSGAKNMMREENEKVLSGI